MYVQVFLFFYLLFPLWISTILQFIHFPPVDRKVIPTEHERLQVVQ